MENNEIKVVLTKEKDCKGSVKFVNPDFTAPLSSVYVNRSFSAVAVATKVEITIKVIG